MCWAFEETTTTGNDRLVLIVLGDYACTTPFGTWETWVRNETLASRTNQSLQGVTDCLGRLERAGLIEPVADMRPDERSPETKYYSIMGVIE